MKLGWMTRFWLQVQINGPDECWPWKGGCNDGGYGKMTVYGESQRTHRIAWELENGAIPDGKFVCHTCDNPPCLNARHLFLGTNKENMIDAGRKLRLARHSRKLSVETVCEVISRSMGGQSGFSIATQMGLKPATVHNITSKRDWRWVHEALRGGK